MTPIQNLLSRSSLAGVFLGPPGPDDAQLHDILGAAQRAADHGRLRPWRFFVIRPAQYAAFYDRLAAAAARGQGDPQRAAKNREKYASLEHVPLLIVAAMKLTEGHKITEFEQTIAAGAATQLVLSAAHALGFSAYLSSGPGILDAALKADFGLAAADHMIGYICIGTPTADNRDPETLPEKVRQAVEATTALWRGPGEFKPVTEVMS